MVEVVTRVGHPGVRAGDLEPGLCPVVGAFLLAGQVSLPALEPCLRAAQELRKNLDAKNYEGVATNAATLKTLFANTQSFWEARKMEDAVGFAKGGAKAATDLEAAAKARNDEAVASQGKTLLATCKTCHDAHRERLPDGTSEIK